jgi:hypothetical protein
MASTVERIAALEELLATGARSTTIDGTTVTFQSRADIVATLNQLCRSGDPSKRPVASSICLDAGP